MSQPNVQIHLVFNADDQAWIRRSAIPVPAFWRDHAIAPAVGDVLRIGSRQFVVQGRVWEHDGLAPSLRLYLGSGGAQSDTTFG